MCGDGRPRSVEERRRARGTGRSPEAPLRSLATISVGLLASVCFAEPCSDNPKDYPIVQFTAEECTCCFELDEFTQDNDHVYVLFYSMKGRLNVDINAKFEQLATEWKWSRIHFGKIDVDKDRDMSKKWVEPNMVPTNVMYKFGRPVEVKPQDFEKIRDQYQGRAEGQMWMLTKYMGEDADGSNLHYVVPLLSNKKVSKYVKNNEVAIIGFFNKENDRYHKVLLESVWKLHQELDRDDVGASFGAVTSQTVAKKFGAKGPSVVVYLDGKVVEEDGTFDANKKWTTKELMLFLRMYLPLNEQDVQAEDPFSGSGGKAKEGKSKQYEL